MDLLEEGAGRTCGTAGAGASSFDRIVLGVGWGARLAGTESSAGRAP